MLHGKIEINHVEVGTWRAVRKETVFNGVHTYDCEVKYRNLQGYPKSAEFQVRHYEKLGALSLTAMVLTTALRKMK